MTYAAIGELVFHLNEVTIGDTYSEGLYRLRISVFTETKGDIEGTTTVVYLHSRLSMPLPTSW